MKLSVHFSHSLVLWVTWAPHSHPLCYKMHTPIEPMLRVAKWHFSRVFALQWELNNWCCSCIVGIFDLFAVLGLGPVLSLMWCCGVYFKMHGDSSSAGDNGVHRVRSLQISLRSIYTVCIHTWILMCTYMTMHILCLYVEIFLSICFYPVPNLYSLIHDLTFL